MKNIKYFKYINTYNFEKFLNRYGYTISDAIGFNLSYKWCYHGNILKQYIIYLNDNEHIYFLTANFKSFNEYQQSRLGFNGDRLLRWYETANIVRYKIKDIYGINDRYVIVM